MHPIYQVLQVLNLVDVLQLYPVTTKFKLYAVAPVLLLNLVLEYHALVLHLVCTTVLYLVQLLYGTLLTINLVRAH
jgi:hypothetical protein